MPRVIGENISSKLLKTVPEWVSRRTPALLDALLHPAVTVAALCVAGVLATMVFGSVLAFLLAACLCKLFTMFEKSEALADFQAAKGIGHGQVTRSEIAEVAMCSHDGRYATQARLDFVATSMVVLALLLVVAAL